MFFSREVWKRINLSNSFENSKKCCAYLITFGEEEKDVDGHGADCPPKFKNWGLVLNFTRFLDFQVLTNTKDGCL